MTVEDFILENDNKTLVRRWLANYLDYLIMFGLFIAFRLLLGKDIFLNLIVLFIIMFFLYFPLLETLLGYSFGKFIVGLRVINNDWGKVSFSKSMIRMIIKLFEANPLLFGAAPAGIVAITNHHRQRFGDKLTNTYVVKTSLIDQYRELNDNKV